MNFYKTILFTAVLFCVCTIAQSQPISRYNTFSYNVNEGLLQSTILDIACDKNNFLWISFPNGIQKFDGKNFINVPVQPGLPDDKFVYFFSCRNGDLLLSHPKGISKYKINSNKFLLVYNSTTALVKPAIFIGEDDNSIYFFSEDAVITGLNNQTFEVVSRAKVFFPGLQNNIDALVKISDNIINHKVAFSTSTSIYLLDLKTKKIVSQSDSITVFNKILLRLKNENEVFYYSSSNANPLGAYNFATHKQHTYPVKAKSNDYVYHSLIHPWKNKTLISFNNKLYETDSAFAEIKSELVNFQNKPVAGNLSIAQIREDGFGNLFLQTVIGGLKKIIRNNYPIKYYGTDKKEDNNIISILPDKKNNRILAGTTGNGLLVFDTLQRLVKNIKTLPGKNTPFSVNAIIKSESGDYLLFSPAAKNAYLLKQDLSKVTVIPFSSPTLQDVNGANYFGNILFNDEKKAIVQTQGSFYTVGFAEKNITAHEVTKLYSMGGLMYGNMVITHANDELIFMDAVTFKQIKKIAFKNTGNVRCFTRDVDGNIYAGSNKGIFKIDSAGKILQHLTKENGLPDECIYAMVFDEAGFLWFSTNKGIVRLDKDNSILQLTKEDGLQENEFNTNIAAKTADGEIFFGGVNGVSSFYPENISSFDEPINLLITQIKINNEEFLKDTAVGLINDLELPYDKNSLSFDFISMANNNPGQYIYQYKMEGVDKQWLQNTDLQTVRYFLPPGSYTFKIYAGRSFDKNAKPMKEIRITINPPFWKTWWFITGIILLSLAALAYAFNRYNNKKYQKKLAVLENEHRIQVERERISRNLHDSIGAYANAVLYNTELLQKENNIDEKNALMNDLKFASKDIITSLRETVWALKKDNYTAEECLLRIKNFVQALSRYYPHIHFKTEGEASAETALHHTKALHVVRIVQEAVTNAIKHAGAKNISLSSGEHAGKWALTVVDDGKGFDYEAIKYAKNGNGLINMNQRATESAIVFLVNSALGGGTKISMLI